MANANASLNQLSAQHPVIQAQDIPVTAHGHPLEKIYWKNTFIGMARTVQANEGRHISDQSKESIKVMTGRTDEELIEAFKTVETLSKAERTALIDTKLSNITLFIEQMNANPRLKAHITRCDVDNLLDQIEKLEKRNVPQEVKARLTACRAMISAFKMDHVLLSDLKDNNAFNVRYYNEGLRDGEKRLEKVQAVLAQAEDGPLAEQLEDLHSTGRLRMEEGVKLRNLKHGDVVCFERVPGQKYGEHPIVFAVVDLIGDNPALHVQNASGNGTTLMRPNQREMELTRLHIN